MHSVASSSETLSLATTSCQNLSVFQTHYDELIISYSRLNLMVQGLHRVDRHTLTYMHYRVSVCSMLCLYLTLFLYSSAYHCSFTDCTLAPSIPVVCLYSAVNVKLLQREYSQKR